MCERSDPSALRFLIGHELRTARERSGVKQSEAAKALDCSQPKIVAMESGKYLQQPEDVTMLLRLYGADVAQIDRLASLAGRADQKTWWASFSDVLPNWFKTFVGLEGLAESQFIYQTVTFTGQLQTYAYARALLAGSPLVASIDVEQIVRARMARQRLALTGMPMGLSTVVEEAVLQRQVGNATVMREQFDHLLNLAGHDHIDIRVLPTRTYAHAGNVSEFTLLHFDEAQTVGYIEYPTGALYLQDYDGVAVYEMLADQLRSAALSKSESTELIRSCAAEWK
ncbi:helix-turn-helix domain-containing protein [Nocardia sp. SYP-A9097]|uniref:helix-turn-helix domain-containing protein n=1 Tax=Nocardia sp. SYP-A9097 TaxID=2663237 RepID=UPI001320C8A2|nr:helix-turn-helix transcriptional regulator [Nocardia sp. SYP-A9097]MRH88632.1 helix-turn-helix domain-containing protein [Nocardia sp. SYP-A9097]